MDNQINYLKILILYIDLYFYSVFPTRLIPCLQQTVHFKIRMSLDPIKSIRSLHKKIVLLKKRYPYSLVH